MSAASPHAQLRSISDSLRSYIESLKEAGVIGVPRVVRADSAPIATSPSTSLSSGEPLIHATSELSESAESAESADLHGVSSLEALREAIGDCRRCRLCEQRTQIVFGTGNPDAELAFVGEGPGYDEDKKGEPFVGRAGQLLTEIITKGMKMRREDVYIANVVKCRPPQNRNPEPDEIAACEPFLRKQLEIVQPRIIIALGAFASQTLLKTKTPISRLRGVWHSYNKIKLMPTLHPAYLLRNPKDKRLVWEDIKAVLRELGRL